MTRGFILLPNQLFPMKYLKQFKGHHFVLFESYEYFTSYKYHPQKILFHITSMRDYRDELKANDIQVTYFKLTDKNKDISLKLQISKIFSKLKFSEVHLFEIEDESICKKIESSIPKTIEKYVHNSPMFITSREKFKEYLSSVKKPFMKTFYERQRKGLDILMKDGKPSGGKYSYDEDNRKKIPKGHVPPKVKFATPSVNFKASKKCVEKYFSSHIGAIEDFFYPTTIKDANKFFENFVSERFDLFGPYEDAIHSDFDFNYHSLISASINIGHLPPKDIIDKTLKLGVKNQIPLNSLEGFIRQIIGWREFIRGIYHNYNEVQENSNFWNHERKLTEHWYSGSTGIAPLDNVIRKVYRFGYCHHIERLMILSNIMLLCEIHPKEVHRWFMEMFVDSSEWVMGPNVYGMGQFSDGGIFATKPYICGSNYIIKMSNYQKGEWSDIVDGLYWHFISKNKKFFNKNPRMSLTVKMFDKISPERKELIFNQRQKFIERVTKPF